MLELSSTTKTFLFLLETLKNKHSSVSDCREYTVSRFKENANIFPKSTTKIFQFQDRLCFFY